jgi:glycine dehydrogenase
VPFADRHIGPSEDEQAKMLAVVGYGSLDELVDDAVPEVIRATEGLQLRRGAVGGAGARALAGMPPTTES